jgi:leader peptidase (prepilin peptidase)/N-methyltransferase
VPMLLRRWDRALPFGPGLAIGVMIAALGWRWIGPKMQWLLFDWMMLFIAGTIMAGGMFVSSLLLGLRKRTEDV